MFTEHGYRLYNNHVFTSTYFILRFTSVTCCNWYQKFITSNTFVIYLSYICHIFVTFAPFVQLTSAFRTLGVSISLSSCTDWFNCSHSMKTLIVSGAHPTDRQGHLLSCSGQLNIARGTMDPEIDSVTWIKFSNHMAAFTLVAYLTTRWHHLH